VRSMQRRSRLDAERRGPGPRLRAIHRLAVSAECRGAEPWDVPQVPVPLIVVLRDRSVDLPLPAPFAAPPAADAEHAPIVRRTLSTLRAPSQDSALLDGG